MKKENHPAVEKLRTGISSLDIIAKGGLPKNRTTLISGTAGSGKTVFAVHFLAAGIELGEPGVFVTFEESAEDVRRNMRGFVEAGMAAVSGALTPSRARDLARSIAKGEGRDQWACYR